MSTQQQPQIQISFSLRTCKCLLFELTDVAKQNQIGIPFDKYKFDFRFKFDLDGEKKTATIRIDSVLSSISDTPGILATLNSINEFLIVNFDKVVVKNIHGQLQIPDAALHSFLSVSVSSLRGMYIIKLEDTIYSNAILPLVDTSQLVPKKTVNLG